MNLRLTADIKVLCIILIKHCRRNVWHISTRITLTAHQNSEVLDLVQVLKPFEEVNERSGDVFFRRRSRDASREPGSNRLVNPNQPSRLGYGDSNPGEVKMP